MAKKQTQSKQPQHSSSEGSTGGGEVQPVKVSSGVTVSTAIVEAAEVLAQALCPYYTVRGQEAVEGAIKFAVIQAAGAGLLGSTDGK